jgi:hypothetical protein
MHAWRIAFAWLAASTVAGCSAPTARGATAIAQSTGSPSSRVVLIDPCSMMTRQEASTMLGVAVGDGLSVAGQCFFRSDASAGVSVTLQLEQKSDSRAAAAAYDAERVRLSSRGVNIVELTSLADAAFIGHAGDMGAIYVRDGSDFYYIVCGPNCTDQALRLGATRVAGRLP